MLFLCVTKKNPECINGWNSDYNGSINAGIKLFDLCLDQGSKWKYVWNKLMRLSSSFFSWLVCKVKLFPAEKKRKVIFLYSDTSHPVHNLVDWNIAHRVMNAQQQNKKS